MIAIRRLADHSLYVVLAIVMSLCLVAIAAGQTATDAVKPAGIVAAPVNAAGEQRVKEAIVAGVRARMGATVDVVVRDLRIRTTGDLPAKVSVVPDIGAQTGGAVRFMLFDAAAPAATPARDALHARRVGVVDAHVSVVATQLRARTAIARGTQVTADDVELATDDVGRQPLKALPPLVRVVGARTVRDIAAGETIASTMLVMPPLVQSGDEVKTRVRIGELEARGIAVAAQSGAMGDEIVLVNAESRRRHKGRVIGEREVEVLH
jgi:flagella basal body P-ring formation protein FlgA